MRGRINKLLKLYVEKENKEMRTSGIELEHTELNDLLLDLHERQASEINSKKLAKERQGAKEKSEETKE